MKSKFLIIFAGLFACHFAALAPLIKVDFYVMSKCPDAKVCEESWPFEAIKSISNSTLNYIATESSSASFTCMHGAPECTGNMQQLCALDVIGGEFAKDISPWWNFVLCQDATRTAIPDNGPACASKAGIDYTKIKNCVESNRGIQLFHDSILATNQAGIKCCCTMYVDNKPRCVHDGEWKDCPLGHEEKDFIKTVCDAYKGTDKPLACNSS